MKKTFLIATITIISLMAVIKSSSHYYNRGENGYNRGYGHYYRGGDEHHDYDMRRDEHKEFHERMDMHYDKQRIAELQYAMQEDSNCGNWEAYRYHERQLQMIYNDISRDRERMYYMHGDERRDAYRY